MFFGALPPAALPSKVTAKGEEPNGEKPCIHRSFGAGDDKQHHEGTKCPQFERLGAKDRLASYT